MKHEFLGNIQFSECDPFDAIAVIRYQSRDIKIGIDSDDQLLETALKLASDVAVRLEELDGQAKRIAASDLRDTYNSGWNEYDQAQEDGSWKSIKNPPVSEVEFAAKLSLKAINVTGEKMIDFFYDDENMFWGHSVVVNSMKVVDLSGAHADLFG